MVLQDKQSEQQNMNNNNKNIYWNAYDYLFAIMTQIICSDRAHVCSSMRRVSDQADDFMWAQNSEKCENEMKTSMKTFLAAFHFYLALEYY